MEHKKTFYKRKKDTTAGPLMIMGPITGDQVMSYQMDENLTAFRRPLQQQKALAEIADLPEGRIIVAVRDDTIIGYVTYLYPDPMERWSKSGMENLLELGAIEVSNTYRHQNVGKEILTVSFLDDAMEDYIIFTTEYYWHWDLKGTGLSVWDYRKVMEKIMASVGLEWFATDDPEICSHPANCLMARLGTRVGLDSIESFDRIRLQNRFFY